MLDRTAYDVISKPDHIPVQRTSELQPFAHDIAIVGLGYVGLPTALTFAASGKSVVGIDISAERLRAILAGDVDALPSDHRRLADALSDDSLVLTDSLTAIADAATVIVCVPTPVDHHLVPDLRPLAGACDSVVKHVRRGQTLILTSTTYVGSTKDLLVTPLQQQRGFESGVDVFVAFSPERIDPGNAHFAHEAVPRVVGGVTPECLRRASETLAIATALVHEVSSPEAAEMTKLYENSFRAINIAFANEMADVSRQLGLDIIEVVDAAATKPYGFMPFYPGPGVGGHCIPCDPHYLLWQLKSDRFTAPLLEEAMTSIAVRPRQVVDRARELLASRHRDLRGASVTVVGVTYKPGVADVRESPALEIIDRLMAGGARVSYVDPLVPEIRLGNGETMHATVDLTGGEPDLVILATVHPDIDYTWVMHCPLVLDTTYRFTAAAARETL